MIAECEFKDCRCHGYSCRVKSLTIREPGVNVSFEGNHQWRRADSLFNISPSSRVIRFQIKRQTMNFFPQNLAAVFYNLTSISIMKCGLKEITKTNLSGFYSLEELNLKYNKLISLPDDLFQNNRSLRVIKFDSNKLRFLSSRLLDPILDTIEVASFRGNPGIDIRFDEEDGDYEMIDELIAEAENPSPVFSRASRSRESSSSTDDDEFKTNLELALQVSSEEFYGLSINETQSSGNVVPAQTTASNALVPGTSAASNPAGNNAGCAICLESTLEVSFIPCGHCSCRTCAASLEKCHICRLKIEGKHRIFCN